MREGFQHLLERTGSGLLLARLWCLALLGLLSLQGSEVLLDALVALLQLLALELLVDLLELGGLLLVP